MFWIIHDQAVFIAKDGRGFLKSDAMLPSVLAVLSVIPHKYRTCHNANIIMPYGYAKRDTVTRQAKSLRVYQEKFAPSRALLARIGHGPSDFLGSESAVPITSTVVWWPSCNDTLRNSTH